MRKKKHPEHVNHERWLISYADFITLLFAFFVVMFAVSQVDSKKVGRFTEAFSKAVGIDVFPMNGDSLMSGGKMPDETSTGPNISGLTSILDELHATLKKMAAENDSLQGLQVIMLRHELVLRLPEGVFFDSGDTRVKDATGKMLKILTPELAKRKLEVRVEGHTDNRPIASGRFRSNWDLSTERASAVMVLLLAEGMPPERVSIAGYAEFRPIADNATDEGRKQNRRVDLVVTAVAVEAKDDKAGAPGEKAEGSDDKAGATDGKGETEDPKVETKDAKGAAKDTKVEAKDTKVETSKAKGTAREDKVEARADKKEERP